MAILFGLQLGNEMNLQQVIVESDCLIAVNELQKEKASFCECASIFQDIQDLSFEFVSCSFGHVNRTINTLAHNLARVHCGVGVRNIWRRFLPPSLCNVEFLSI